MAWRDTWQRAYIKLFGKQPSSHSHGRTKHEKQDITKQHKHYVTVAKYIMERTAQNCKRGAPFMKHAETMTVKERYQTMQNMNEAIIMQKEMPRPDKWIMESCRLKEQQS